MKDIKDKLFKMKIRCCIKASVKLHTKALARYLNIIIDFGIPRNDEEKEFLREVIESYDETVQKLEKYLKYARKDIGN